MLEATIVLQVAIGEYVGAVVVGILLAFNAALGFFQEGRAQATLAALKSRLAMTAVVRRNSVWTTLPAAELVLGDIVKLSLGVVVAADMRLVEGFILLDQSMLTGNRCPRRQARAFKPMPQPWCGAAKQLPRLQRPDRARNSVEPPNSYSTPMP
jgi:H+-transporting ATPase